MYLGCCSSTMAGRTPDQRRQGFKVRSGSASARAALTPRLWFMFLRKDAEAETFGDCTGPSDATAVPRTSHGMVYVAVFPSCCLTTMVAFAPMLVACGYQPW